MQPERARSLMGISQRAGEDDIRRRYHLLARDLHPDGGGDVDEFRELQQAYAVLLATRGGAPTPADGADRAAAHRAELDRQRRERERIPVVDVDGVDWSRPLPATPAPLDEQLLAVAVFVGRAVAVSRGPRALLNRLAPSLDDSLVARVELAVPRTDGTTGQRVAASGRRGRLLMDDLRGRHGWHVVRRSSDLVIASRSVPVTGDRRVDALRHVHFAVEALDTMRWPLRTWRLVEPLGPASGPPPAGATPPPGRTP